MKHRLSSLPALYLPGFPLVLGLLLGTLVSFSACKSSKKIKQSDSAPIGLAGREPVIPSAEQISQLYIDATTQMIRGDYRMATEFFQQVLKLEPQHAAANYNLAKLSIEQRQYEDAIRFGKIALSSDPSNYWYYQVLQQAYEYQGEYQRAIDVQQEITRQFPHRIEDRFRLSELFLQNQQAEEAIQELKGIEQEYGNNEEVNLRLFRIYKQQNKLEETLALANRLLELNEEQTRYYQMQFEALTALGREEEAIRSMEQLLEKDPENGFALLSLADYYKNQNDAEKSDEYLFRAFANPEIDPAGKIQIIQSLMSFVAQDPSILSRLQQMAEIFQETHPGSSQAFALQGKLAFLEGSTDTARIYYQQSLELEPSNIPVWMDLIETSFNVRNFEQLNKDAEMALEYYPNQEQFLYFFGVSSIQIQELGAATNALEKIKRIGTAGDQLMAQACAELGQIYHVQEKYEQSDLNFQKALSLTPEDDLLQNNYAYILAQRKENLEEAAQLIQRALTKYPERASYLDTYGWILYQQGKYTEAETQLAKAAALSESATILEHYGDTLYRLGKQEAAIQQWKKAQATGSKLDIERKLQQ